MTTFLFNLPLTEGADRMAQVDPHGWTLTLISVSVVFCALIILYFVYSFSGDFFSGKIKLKKRTRKGGKAVPDEETAIAIALALNEERGSGEESERAAAIATALHLYLSESVHDIETGVITIRRKNSPWGNKERNFRKLPTR